MSHTAIALGMALMSRSSAEPPTPVVVATPAVVKVPVAPVKAAVPIVVSGVLTGKEKIQISFVDTSVAAIFRALSTRLKVNIVYSGTESTPVTFNIAVNTPEEAVRSVVAAAGLAYKLTDNTYVVAKPDALKNALSPFSVRTRFSVPLGQAAIIAEQLRPLFPNATVSVFGDKVLFTGVPEDIREAQEYVTELSSNPSGQPRSVDVFPALTDPQNLIASVKPLFEDLTFRVENGIITMTGPTPRVAEAKTALGKLDAAQSGKSAKIVMQMYEVKFVTAGALQRFIKSSMKGVEAIIPPRTYTPDRGQFIPLNAALSLQAGGGGGGAGAGGGAIGGLGAQVPIPAPVAGVEGQDDRENELSRYLILRGPANLVEDAFKLIESIDVKPPQVMVEVNVLETSPTFLQNFGVAYGFGPLQFLEVKPGTGVDVPSFRNDNITKPAGLGTWSRVPWDITATVNALVRDGQAKLLANPRVQVMDNNSASIFIGDTLRVQVAQAGALGAQTIQIQEFPVGIILLIRPKISPDGSITLRVNPVVSSIRSIDSNGLPQTTTREAETTLVLKDAETVTLGGLIREEESSFVQKIPILGDLPIVGELFKTRNRNRQKVDVVVTITTRIVKDAPSGNK